MLIYNIYKCSLCLVTIFWGCCWGSRSSWKNWTPGMGNVEDLSSQEWSTAFIFHHSPYHPCMVYLITYIYHKKWPNVSKYTSPMNGMGSIPSHENRDHLELCHSRKRGKSRCSARSAAINLGFRFLKKSIHCSSVNTCFMMSDILYEKGFISFTRTSLVLYNSTMIHKSYITLSWTQPYPTAHPLASLGSFMPPGCRWKSHLARSRRCPPRSGEVWC